METTPHFPKCNSLHIMSKGNLLWLAVWLKGAPDGAFRAIRGRSGGTSPYFPLSSSLAIVASCMFDVPS
jgi:hypothetical protein